jgi:GAF domain-containing protein
VNEVDSSLDQLHSLLASGNGLDAALDQLVQAAAELVGADAASITVMDDDTPRTAATTDQQVLTIDKEQYAAGDGPCLQAARLREPVRARLPEAQRRWPAFASAAELAGIRAYLATPLMLEADGPLLGALNLYSGDSQAFDPVDKSLMSIFVRAASDSIVADRRYREVSAVAAQLRQALDSRADIDQAIGVLMAVHQLSAKQAFELLAQQSQNSNTKLRDVARRLLDSLVQKRPEALEN